MYICVYLRCIKDLNPTSFSPYNKKKNTLKNGENVDK